MSRLINGWQKKSRAKYSRTTQRYTAKAATWCESTQVLAEAIRAKGYAAQAAWRRRAAHEAASPDSPGVLSSPAAFLKVTTRVK